ncbi:MAG: DUF3443 family protein [Terriglobales bacterium]
MHRLFFSSRCWSVILPAILAGSVLGIAGCGSGSSSSSSSGGNNIAPAAANVAAIVVDSGPTALTDMGSGYVNGAFVSVTVCNPSATTSCQTIDHVLVDTGSIGLRLLSVTGDGEFSLDLPNQTDTAGNPLSECALFADNVSYGSVRLANVQISGEKASNVPMQVIGDLTSIPVDCASAGPIEDTLATLGANGILGVGPFPQDCGEGCLTSVTENSAIYYSCPTSGCVDTILTSVAQEVTDPVVLFPTDNNGVIVELPSIPIAGANNVAGSLVFGINTESNNGLGAATVFPLDTGTGNLVTIFGGSQLNECGFVSSSGQPVCGFIDSGTNTFATVDPSLLACSDNTSFACTNKTYSGSTVENEGATGSPTQGVSFSVESADTLFGQSNCCTAYNDLAAPGGGTTWDWGLPLFFGRNIYSSIEGQTVSGQTASPFVAY